MPAPIAVRGREAKDVRHEPAPDRRMVRGPRERALPRGRGRSHATRAIALPAWFVPFVGAAFVAPSDRRPAHREPAAAKRDRVDHAARAAASDDPGAARPRSRGGLGAADRPGDMAAAVCMADRGRVRLPDRTPALEALALDGRVCGDELRLLHGDCAARPRARSTARTRRRRIRWRTTPSRNGSRTPGLDGSGSCSGPASWRA